MRRSPIAVRDWGSSPHLSQRWVMEEMMGPRLMVFLIRRNHRHIDHLFIFLMSLDSVSEINAFDLI